MHADAVCKCRLGTVLATFALTCTVKKEPAMNIRNNIEEHMEIIGADGVHVGIVDKVEGNRIKLTRNDPDHGNMAGHEGHHHYLDLGLAADVEDGKLRLSANANVAMDMLEEGDGR
jgi:hypothetical protein